MLDVGCTILNLRHRVWSQGFGVEGLGFDVQGLGVSSTDVGCRVKGLGPNV
jgi:hypothetical protein